MDYITKVEICDKSKVYLRCMKKIPILIMLDNGRIGYKEIEKEDKEAITEILSAIAQAQLALDKARRALMELMELMEGEEHEML